MCVERVIDASYAWLSGMCCLPWQTTVLVVCCLQDTELQDIAQQAQGQSCLEC